ncbi:MAG TPA: MBL fold metallo-hydrolase [Chitinophagaceae bacterium]|jgi:glyoxylase-like metal-dependent hydrolase (beta-lactamase superfamily II)|nr:MBL fold metallo-hydrolase [Chitinophagaceae bacterium]
MKEQIICSTCGTYYLAENKPETCIICLDERQWVPETGQSWTKPGDLHLKHSVKLNRLQDRLYEIEINPVFAIGQRALLVLSEKGNVLWDCIPLLDELTIEFIRSKGGLKAIGFSHPHFYSNMNDWANLFDCPVFIHQNDAEHIMSKGDQIQLWRGDEMELWDGIKIMLIGGHFAGSSILHVPFLSKEGTIICGDTLFLSPGKKHFSVVYSSPNRMPLPLKEMRRIKERFETIPFDSFYGYHRIQNLSENVKEIVELSMNRYFA